MTGETQDFGWDRPVARSQPGVHTDEQLRASAVAGLYQAARRRDSKRAGTIATAYVAGELTYPEACERLEALIG